METIGRQKIWSFTKIGRKSEATTCTEVRHGNGLHVTSYVELATKVAELQFMNRDFVLLFRGQPSDWRNKPGNSTLKPSILRAANSQKAPSEKELSKCYETLLRAEQELVSRYRAGNTPGATRLRRQQILRWAILQHYEVCKTPLLDVTHSLRIAASFASHDADDEAFIYVLGVPNLSGAVTASAEAGLQIIRLASVCPPSALRPHFQEGYLLGEYPEIGSPTQKQHYRNYEIDFGRRLVAKFKFNPKEFWHGSYGVPEVRKSALYPGSDPLLVLAQAIKDAIS